MYDASYLEDYHTKLGLNVFSDHESLMQMKNICKLYFYCGHSNGKKYFNSNLWKETRINFPSFNFFDYEFRKM